MNRNNKSKIKQEIGRLLPQSIEFESAVLGALLIDARTYSIVCNILAPEYFYDKKHELIYSAILDLASQNKPINIITVSQELKKNGNIDFIGGSHYIAELSSKCDSYAHTEYHAKIIKEKYLARRTISLTNSIQEQIYDDNYDIDTVLEKLQKEAFCMMKNFSDDEPKQINPAIRNSIEQLMKNSQTSKGVNGIPSGFDDLDKITFGWQKGDFVIIAARPAMGKSSFILSMLKNIVIENGISVGIFSLEMTEEQLLNRLISNICDISIEKIRSGLLPAYEWEMLDYKLKELYDAPIYIDNTPTLFIEALCKKARNLVINHDVKIIFIDYIQLMAVVGKYTENRYAEVNYISRTLKSLAKELNIPIIAVSQLNRSVENRTDNKKPQLWDLRDSGTLCDDADIICFIHRPEYYKIYTDEKGNDLTGKAEIMVSKNRNGATKDLMLRFQREYCRFSNNKIEDERQEYHSRINKDSFPKTTDNSETPF